MFLIEAGFIRVERSLRSGRTVLLTLAAPGQLLGELSVIEAAPRSATALTIGDCRVLAIPSGTFVELLSENGELCYAVLSRVTQRLGVLTDQLVEATTLSAAARVAARVVEVLDASSVKPQPDGSLDLRMPISQEDLAQWAGLSREGAVKGFAELRAAGIVETSRKRIVIPDQSRLRSVAAGALL